MRLPRVRFTVRRMIALVAVIALVLGVSIGAFRLNRQRDIYLKLASEHEQLEVLYRNLEQSDLEMAQFNESLPGTDESSRTRFDAQAKSRPIAGSPRVRELKKRTGNLLADIARQRRESVEQNRAGAALSHKTAMHHAALKQKYLAAAARPWRSVEPDPPPPDPWGQGEYWRERGDCRRALAAYEELLEGDPDNEMGLNSLAWLLATVPDASLRDGKRAIELATRACEWNNWANASCLDTLAAAYAETDDFAQAVAMQNKAIANLPAGDSNLPAFRERLQLYEHKKPYREQPKSGT
jgi:tetratricopeptide (TPR) repeat protein